MKTKIAILILSLVYGGYLLTVWAGDHYQSTSLNPLNSEYYSRRNQFVRAIETEPAKAVYHMMYALDLIDRNPGPDAETRRRVFAQLTQAVKLKPFSKEYRKIYQAWSPFFAN